MRKSIKVPMINAPFKKDDAITVYDPKNPHKKYLRCSHPDVVCSLTETANNSNTFELKFKYKTESAPNTKALYFMLYYDIHQTVLAEVWRVFVHSLQRLDVTCILGQTNNAALIVKGGSMSRAAQSFSNQPHELLVIFKKLTKKIGQPGSFLLTGNSLNEIELFIKPKTATNKDIILNIIGNSFKDSK